MIRLEGLRLRVGRFELQDISLEVPGGGYALIIGPTGSGKTTLLEAIAGHAPLEAGRVLLDGKDMTDLPPERRRIGFVYQHYHLFPHLSVRENIGYGLTPSHRRAAATGGRTRSDQVAELLGIHSLLDRSIRGLSGGERQRVALARALAPGPSILLLDEPFAAVDPAARQVLRQEVRALHEREGITTLQVTHDFEEALGLGDLVAVLAEGRIVQRGTPAEVFRFPNSVFVAQFVGSGNIIKGVVEACENGAPGVPFGGRFRGDGLVLDVVAQREGPHHAVIRPEDIVLSLKPQEGSARNQLRGRAVRLERRGPVTLVYLDVGRPLVAAITTASADALGLEDRPHLTASFKATAVHLV